MARDNKSEGNNTERTKNGNNLCSGKYNVAPTNER